MSEVKDDALAKFLLARYDEEEERADFVRRQREGSPFGEFEAWRLSWHDEYDLLCIEPSRALAECGAKREIVDWHSGHAENIAGRPCRTLRALALPYAEHPDCRPEWQL